MELQGKKVTLRLPLAFSKGLIPHLRQTDGQAGRHVYSALQIKPGWSTLQATFVIAERELKYA